MAHHFISIASLPEGGETLASHKVSGIRNFCFIAGFVGLVTSAIIFLFDLFQLREPYAYSWLFSLAFFFTIGCGALFWVMLHHATNSGWGIAVRRLFEQISNLLPYITLLALPLLLPGVRNALYEWMLEHDNALNDAGGNIGVFEALHHSHVPDHHLLVEKFSYLNKPFWFVRFAFYLIALSSIAYFLLKATLKQEKDGFLKHTFFARGFSRCLFPIFAICLTFASIDWFKGLDYTWYSTMFGVYIFAGSALSSMALAVILLTFLRKLGYLQKVTSVEHYHLMGKLMLTFVIFWAYISFDQFFLMWYANITEETKFFLIRNTEGWNYLSIFIVAFHFFVPFLLLLPDTIKKNPLKISLISILILIMHVVDMYWLIIPERGPSLGIGITFPGVWILDILAFLTMLSFLTWALLGRFTKLSLYPWRDPRLQESINVHN